MTEVDIEFCVPCGLLPPALETLRAVFEAFGRELDGVRLTPGHGGVFMVRVDGELIWDRRDHDGAIDPEAITAAIEHEVHD